MSNYFNAVIDGIHYKEFRVPVWERLAMLPVVFWRHWHCTTSDTPINLKWFVAYELTKSYWLNETRIIYKPAK